MQRFTILMLTSLIWLQQSYSQVSISGPTCVTPGTQYQYSISGNWNSGTNMNWCISGGVISGYGTCRSGTPLPSVYVIWNTGPTSGTVTLNSSIGNRILSVSITTILAGGAISANKTQTINYNHIPLGINCSAAGGGSCSPTFNYQWQQSTDNLNFTAVSGATGLNLSFSTGLLQTMYYRRMVTETSSGSTAYSDVATVFVNPQLQGNILGPAVQDIFTGATPGQIGGAPAYGGGCGSSYTYQWQQSTDNVNFNSISGATGTTYNPGVLSVATYYKRQVSCSGDVAYSSVATINVHNHLAPGSITNASTSITYNTGPGLINATVSTGGICSSYSYQWWQSPDNSTFTAISGTTAQTYTPGNLTSTRYYKRQTVCGSENQYTNTLAVTVMPQLSSGTITGNTGPLIFNNPPGILSGTDATGGNCGGTYDYQWQMSYDGTNYNSITGATYASYSSDPLQINTYFRRKVVCGSETAYSNVLNISVHAQIFPGSVIPGFLAINTNSSPGILTANTASGGSCGGAFSYQWQSSGDNITWTNISGASAPNYTVGNLSATTYFRRQVSCGSDIVYTNVSTISVGTVNTADLNYLRVRTISKPQVTDPAAAASLTDPADVKQATQYIEGLGDLFQTVLRRVTPLFKDLVSVNFLDNGGREVVNYMPYVSATNDGNYKAFPLTEQNTFNAAQFPGETSYYSQTDFENSDLNRVNAVYAQGSSWAGSGRGIASQYQLNTVSDSVINWTIAAAQGSIPVNSGIYSAGTLYKNVTIDEQLQQVVTYKDLDGRLLLKKVQLSGTPGTAHTGWLNTYYVYDDLENLRFVISPRAMEFYLAAVSLSTTANELCFRYEYDQRKRMIIKKVPGAGEVWMVYDSRDRLIMTQDANLRVPGKWMVTEYDSEDRPWRTGLLTDANSRAYHQNLAYNSISYPNTSGNYEVLTQTYYEDYSWVAGTGTSLGSSLDATNTGNSTYFITGYNTSPVYSQAISQNHQTRSLVTGSMVKVIGTTSQYLYTVNFYDDRNRLIQSQRINVTGGRDETTSQYDFSGKLIRSLVQHQKNGTNAQSHTIVSKMNYDAGGRLLTIYKNIDSAPSDQLISTNTYNELGQLQNKQLGSNLDNLAYAYNIRGWLTSINKNFIAGTPGNYFGMELGYDKAASAASNTSYTNLQYNGNIAGTVWKTAGDGVGRKYDFAYDNVNRLTGANFNQNAGAVFDKSAGLDFSVSGLAYDANGNILTMNQMGYKVGGSSLIDQLSYTYQTSSNKLAKVTDALSDPTTRLGDFHDGGNGATDDYSYDGNGNLTLDNNKAISGIIYNYLNLPQQVTVTSKGTVSYTYDAAGTKLYKTTVDNTVSPSKTTVTMYQGPFVYQNDSLQFVANEEGRARWAFHKYTTGGSAYGFEYDFFEKDHLGNTRVVLTQQKDTAKYLASGEAAYRTTEAQLFNNLTTTAVARSTAAGYPNDVTVTNPNDTVFKVNGNVGGHKMGPSLLLKVMSGDKIDLGVQEYYNSGSTGTPNTSLTDVLASLATGVVNLTSGGKGSLADLNNTGASPIYAALNSFLTNNDPNPTGKPKAYLNWILLDEQLKYVSSYPQSGALVVGAAGTLNSLGYTGIPITKSGYLYIWVSNETPNWDVFFDNLAVKHYTGPMLEETHYYPGGLTMARISSKALKPYYAENKYKFNKGSELQNKEFSDESGLELYDTHFRQLDPQLGRWWQVDPMPDYAQSPYSAMDDNPILHNDPLGDTVNIKGFTKAGFLKDLGKGIKTGSKNNPFYFNKKGNLEVNDKLLKKLSGKQIEIVKNIEGAIDSKMNFTVEKVNKDDKIEGNIIGDNGEVIRNPSYKIAKMLGQTKRVDETHTTIKVVDPREGIDQRLKDPDGKSIDSSPTWLSIYHEVGGHAYYKYVEGDSRACKAIDYENQIRSLNGMELRGYDDAHPDK